MKIVCTKSNLVKGVSIVSKAVPSKTTMSILECVLIDATTDIIRLTANDMELGIQTDIEGEIIERGMIAIDAKFFQTVMSLSKQTNLYRLRLSARKQNSIFPVNRAMNFLIFQSSKKTNRSKYHSLR